MSRPSILRPTLLALSLTLTPSLALLAAAPQESVQIRYTGNTWRGAIGDRIEVTFREGGRDQTVTGVLNKVDRFAMTLEQVVVDGRTGRKVIVIGDVRSVKSVDGGTTATGGAGSKDAPATGGSGAPKEGTGTTTGSGAPSEPIGAPKDGAAPPTIGTKSESLMEHPDTAGPITGPRADGKKTVFVLPLNGGVGTGLRVEEMDKIEKEADKLGPGQIIIMRINSPGGAVSEAEKIYESLTRIKKKHRLVAWIEEAISGGAFTGLIADELYFMDVGALGAITMYSGAESIKGRELQAWLDKIFEVCEVGGRPGHICRCMVYSAYESSYDVDPETGRVTWHEDASGEFVISKKGDNLVIGATDAVRSKFAQGRANTEYELFKAMQLDEGAFVVSHAGKRIAGDWQRLQDQCNHEVPRLVLDYQLKGTAQGAETVLGVRINALKKLIAWWDRAPNAMWDHARNGIVPLKETLVEMLKDLQRQLADLQKQKAEERRNRG